MKRETATIEAMVPEVDDFIERYPQYRNVVENNGRQLFYLVMSPHSFYRAKWATEQGLPAVLGVAQICFDALALSKGEGCIDNLTKQFIGAMVCCLMEANGYQKDGRKSVPHHAFVKGTVYQKKQAPVYGERTS